MHAYAQDRYTLKTHMFLMHAYSQDTYTLKACIKCTIHSPPKQHRLTAPARQPLSSQYFINQNMHQKLVLLSLLSQSSFSDAQMELVVDQIDNPIVATK